MANRDAVFSLLVACLGKTCWNQIGRIKSQVHLPARHSHKVCCLLSKRWGDTFHHIYIFTCDGTYFILHSPQKRILRQEFELKYFEKWYQKLSWESGEVRRGWEESSWRCVNLRVNTVAPRALSREDTVCDFVEHTPELSTDGQGHLSIPLWLRIAARKMSSWHI